MKILLHAGPRSLTYDEKYVFLTSSSLTHLLKLGSGKRGTIRGLVYASQEVEPGWLVCVNGTLLHHKLHSEGGVFCRVVNKDTLNVSLFPPPPLLLYTNFFSSLRRRCV